MYGDKPRLVLWRSRCSRRPIPVHYGLMPAHYVGKLHCQFSLVTAPMSSSTGTALRAARSLAGRPIRPLRPVPSCAHQLRVRRHIALGQRPFAWAGVRRSQVGTGQASR
jgi:hypothetical protein